jgi:VanZ family protein
MVLKEPGLFIASRVCIIACLNDIKFMKMETADTRIVGWHKFLLSVDCSEPLVSHRLIPGKSEHLNTSDILKWFVFSILHSIFISRTASRHTTRIRHK